MRFALLTSYAVSFILGILLSYFNKFPLWGFILCSLVCGTTLIIRLYYRYSRWNKALLISMFFLFGCINLSLTKRWIEDSVIIPRIENIYTVVTDPVKTSYGYKCYAKTQNIKVELSVGKSVRIRYGDIITSISVPKLIKDPVLFESFDKPFFMLQQHVKYQVFAKDFSTRRLVHGFDLLAIVYRFRHVLEKRIDYFLMRPHNSILKALTLGIKSDLDTHIRREFMETGTIHVLAVSGLHVGIIYLIVGFLLQKIPLKSFFIIVLMWGFASLTGFSQSVVRAVIFLTVTEVGKVLNRKSKLSNSLAFTTIILLCLNPYTIFSVGFQLSFSAVLGIVLFLPFFKKYYDKKTYLMRFLYEIIAVSISVQLTVVPIILYHFHTCSISSIIGNLFVIPYTICILWCSVPFFTLPYYFTIPMDNVIYSMLFYLDLVYNWSNLYVINVQYTLYQCILSFIALASCYLLLIKFRFHVFIFLVIIVGIFSSLTVYNIYKKQELTELYYIGGLKYSYLVCNQKGTLSYIPIKGDNGFVKYTYNTILTEKSIVDAGKHPFKRFDRNVVAFMFEGNEYQLNEENMVLKKLSLLNSSLK